jgi:uncharacterized protein YjiS (DUF1127 family)
MSTQNIPIEGAACDALTNENLKSVSTAAVAAGKGLIWRAVTEFIRYRALRAAEAKLYGLDDRMLKDIGLDRSEIKSALLNARQERLNGARYIEPPIV